VAKPQTAIETLPYRADIFPNIKLLLQTFTTHVTTATPEHTLSTLKRLKIYLRSTVTENRLHRLGLVNINKKDVISEIEIIVEFATKKHQEDCNSQIGQNHFIQLGIIIL